MSRSAHPEHWSNGPRVGARGVVLLDGRILLLKYERDGETLYLFPGGGHEPGETLAETVRREVHEEAGLSVEVGRLLAVHEYQPSKREEILSDIRSIYLHDVHRVDLFLECHVVGDAEPTLEVEPDKLHTGFAWVEPDDLDDYPIIPRIGSQIRESLGHSGNPALLES